MRGSILFFLIFINSFYVKSQINCDFIAEGDNILIEIIEGYGESFDSAELDAKRNAVNQAVGVYISSETLLNNDKIDYDYIKENSRGLIVKSCILSQDIIDDEHVVRIKSVIGREKMYKTLSQAGVKIDFDSKIILIDINSEKNILHGEQEIVNTILKELNSGDPFIYSIKESGLAKIKKNIGSQTVTSKSNFKVKLSIAIKPNYGNYLKNLENALKNTAALSYTDDFILVDGKKGLFYFPFNNTNDALSSKWLSSNKLLFINKIYKNFESKDFNKIFKIESEKKGKVIRITPEGRKSKKKEKFLKKYNGINYHVNASIMSFSDPNITSEIASIIEDHISEDYFLITLYSSNGVVLDTYPGKYNHKLGKVIFDGQSSSTKSQNTRTKSDKIEVVRKEYSNLKQLKIQSVTANNESTFITNELGSYTKEVRNSTIGILVSLVPIIYSSLRFNNWSSSNVSPYGFSANYNPIQTELNISTTSSIISSSIFSIWRYSLFNAPLKIFKLRKPEQTFIFSSDLEYIKSKVTLNANKQGLIEENHEIFNWDIFKNKNNTLSVSYIELPIKIEDLEKKLSNIEIKRISKARYRSELNNKN